MTFDKKKFQSPYSFLFGNINLRTKTLLIIALVGLILITIVINSLFINVDNITTNFAIKNSQPSFQHPFGTDWMGRDMLSRTMKGLGLSVTIGALASILSVVISIFLGLLSTLGKYFDYTVNGLTDLFLSIPHILLIMMISISLGGGITGIVVGVSLTHWTSLTRLLRAEIKQINTSTYVKISKNFGKTKWWIAKHHLLPLLLPQIVVGTIIVFPHAIMHEASVTFLGFGLSPHEPAIGVILAESMKYLSNGAWWLAFFPGLSLLIIVLLFDVIGDNVQRLLDPTQANE